MADQVTLQLGHSPDPDDAFMFYALAQDPPLVDAGRWRFQHVMQDIQTLSHRAKTGDLEFTAISVATYPLVADKYAITSCGASMGDGYGPMLVAKTPMKPDDLREKRVKIAVPGTLTSAFLTCQLFLGKAGEAFDYEVVMFDEIPQAVLSGRADVGLLIHEGQLTYRDMGLHLIADLGIWWNEHNDGLPLPLGCNCIRRDLDAVHGEGSMTDATRVLRDSIQYSLDNREAAVRYSMKYGRDLDTATADKFVGMYVNDWTLDYGPSGKEAITRFLRAGAAAGYIPAAPDIQFVTP
ncbi:MAG: MqnA/MqnD/SBP family protein [Planctomycetota bacterium]